MRHATLSRVGVVGGLAFATAFAGDAISHAPPVQDGARSPSARSVDPLPLLRGSTLSGRTWLRLIVANAPPYVLDVDRHTVHRVADVARAGRDGVAVAPFRGGALATVFPLCSGCAYRERFFALKSVGAATPVARRLGLAAERNAAPRWVAERGADGRVTLLDHATGARHRVRWPSTLGGLGGVVGQPHGPFLALVFGDPAYPGPEQAEDIFLLDTHTGKVTHVPGFPAQIDLKFSSIAWASGNRLVLMIHAADRTTLGIYHPGDRSVALRRVRVPQPIGGSATFVPITKRR